MLIAHVISRLLNVPSSLRITEIFYNQDVDNQENKVKEWNPEISSEPRNIQYRNGIQKNLKPMCVHYNVEYFLCSYLL